MNMKLYSQKDLLEALQVPSHKVEYLFRNGKLKRGEFLVVGGQRIFTAENISKIRRILKESKRIIALPVRKGPPT